MMISSYPVPAVALTVATCATNRTPPRPARAPLITNTVKTRSVAGIPASPAAAGFEPIA